MRYTSSHATTRRSGVVLLVVMALLAIFAALGLSFVFYADNEAIASQYNAQSLAQDQPDVDPEVLAAQFLSQLLYGTANPYSAMRGWDMATSMYGYNPDPNYPNHVPFNGIGRKALSYPVTGVFPTGPEDNFNLINYQRFFAPPAPAWNAAFSYVPYDRVISISDGNTYLCIQPNSGAATAPPAAAYWLLQPVDTWSANNIDRKPEFYGDSSNPASFLYRGGANPPWTAYDTNNMFLAEMNANGTITGTKTSFYRGWTNSADSPNIPDPSAKAKYMSLRPHATWNPGFNPTLTGFPFGLPDSDAGGDVRNSENVPGVANANNDSRFMDLGFPIMTAPNGKRYRPLFAPLIVDLNNRLHLWAHGNHLGSSNMGYGPPEVNLGKFLINGGVLPAELTQLNQMKYGPPGTPVGSVPPGILRPGPYGAPVDGDGTNGGVSTGPLKLPVGTGPEPFWTVPTFGAGWDNTVGEINKVPLAFDMFNPTLPNAPALQVSNMEALLRFRGTNGPALTSEIFRRMPVTFTNNNGKARRLVTLRSWGLDRIMTAPYIFDPAAAPYTYDPAALVPDPFPKGLDPTPPNPGAVPAPVLPPNSEFTEDWRSNFGKLLRVNINRQLADYPPQKNVDEAIDITLSAVQDAVITAQVDRQMLAKDIYNALVRVTGAQDPNIATATPPTALQFNATRWLAQLAVNVVDYVDNDDYITPFLWFTDPTDNTKIEWVYGTEVPRLVINEAYASQDNNTLDAEINDPLTPTAKTSKLNVWVEMHNPMGDDTKKLYVGGYPRDKGKAILAFVNPVTTVVYPAYQVVIAKSGLTLRDPANTKGDPDASGPNTWSVSKDWGTTAATMFVMPGNGVNPAVPPVTGPAGNAGFYVLGPKPNAAPTPTFVPTRDPNLGNLTTHTTNEMYVVTNEPITLVGGQIPPVTLVLQRLANPHLPPDNNPGAAPFFNPFYNPYITVDYLDSVKVWDSRFYDMAGPKIGFAAPALIKDQYAFGRKQPYSAFNNPATPAQSQVVAQAPLPPLVVQPQHTFYRHNSREAISPFSGPPLQTLDIPFDWLVHLDRPVVNTVELMHVSSQPPHALTQKFISLDATNNLRKFMHLAPWGPRAGQFTPTQVQEARIYRALDLLGAPIPMAGALRGGRWPGSVNINTMTDREVFRSLCDTNNVSFTAMDVRQIFTQLNNSRNAADPLNPPTLASEGHPFRSLASGNLANTVLRLNTAVPPRPIFEVAAPTAHPYQQEALLQKILNNVTTTSNVFAVWWTVGFFEVVDESVRPARLGREIGRDENRHIRHRFFAIVDRSGLELFKTRSTNFVDPGTPWSSTVNYFAGQFVRFYGVTYRCITASTNNPPASSPAYWTPITMNFDASPLPPNVLPVQGMALEIDQGPNAEVVIVKSVAGLTFTADFTKTHASGVPIVCRGNPGPKTPAPGAPPLPPGTPLPLYNPRQDPNVVLHLSVIR